MYALYNKEQKSELELHSNDRKAVQRIYGQQVIICPMENH